ncbi:DUF3857 domain-containing protein [Seonamhaeicola algicola]|uniref:DUF3857 domain-containing protein n=1 Tax=Seonamhaeicola algicola TaxID=1719036 RepID=A0A5C7AVJ4_9FLAO|nr:DUF3857 domain-containing protein [Seonamhaeicola algicola]TXE09782.1 DUF3857 domain-containing protein [Seonamhaeicola algicola]
MKQYFVLALLLTIHFTILAQENLYTTKAIPESLLTNANAVIRLNEIAVSIESQQEMVITSKRIITVLNEAGFKHVGAYLGYDKYRKIKKIEAIIFDENGNEIKKIKKKDFVDHSAVDGGTLYSDSRVLYMSYMPVSYPLTIAFFCEVETPNTAAIPSWRPIDDYYLSIEKDVYSITDNANLGLKTKPINFEDFNVETNEINNTSIFKLVNTKAIKPEALSPSLSWFTPKAIFTSENFHFYGVNGEASNWLEFGNWVENKLLKDRREVSEATKNKIISLTKDYSDPLKKAEIVYKYVQDNTRYISVQVGIGGVQPISAMDVDRLKYGDCKGLTNYTQSLLNIAGVKSYYTIVEAGNEKVDFYDDFYSLAQGNHIILCIPNSNDNVWIDCTSQKHPFGFIGDFTDDRNVLVVKPNASQVVKTTAYINEINHKKTKANIFLDETGDIQANVNIKSYGINYDRRFFVESESDKNINEFYKELWDYVNNLSVNNYAFTNDKKHVEFTESLKINAQHYAAKIGDGLIFKPNTFNRNLYIPNRYRNRKMPLKIQRGYFDEDEFTIQIPAGYTLEAVPNNEQLTNKFGEYSISFEINQKEILYKRKLLIKAGNYPKEDYALYRSFRKSVAKFDNLSLVIRKTE